MYEKIIKTRHPWTRIQTGVWHNSTLDQRSCGVGVVSDLNFPTFAPKSP